MKHPRRDPVSDIVLGSKFVLAVYLLMLSVVFPPALVALAALLLHSVYRAVRSK